MSRSVRDKVETLYQLIDYGIKLEIYDSMYGFREHSLRLPIALKKNPAVSIFLSQLKLAAEPKRDTNPSVSLIDKIIKEINFTKKLD